MAERLLRRKRLLKPDAQEVHDAERDRGAVRGRLLCWTQENAKAIRALGKLRLNVEADFEHAEQEITDLGKSQLHGVENRMITIIELLLKLQSSPAAQPRAGRRAAVRQARDS